MEIIIKSYVGYIKYNFLSGEKQYHAVGKGKPHFFLLKLKKESDLLVFGNNNEAEIIKSSGYQDFYCWVSWALVYLLSDCYDLIYVYRADGERVIFLT